MSDESSAKQTLLSLLDSNLAPLFLIFIRDPKSALCASAFSKLELLALFVMGIFFWKNSLFADGGSLKWRGTTGLIR